MVEVDPRSRYTPDPLSTEIIQSLSPRHLPSSIEEYFELEKKMADMEDVECLHLTRVMAREDLYFLLRYVLTTRDWKDPENTERSFWDKEWLLARSREIQFSSVDTLNIWARYHAKSTICTFGNGIRLLLSNPNETIGIFSVTKGVADEFVNMLKYELESNEELKALYPDRLYQDPKKEAPRWTVEKGFTIRRTLNLAGASVRGFGLTDSNYTGHRFSKQIFDDAVNETGVTTPDMIAKARSNSAEVGLANVKFIEGYSEELPVPTEWADVIISNGAVNLAPEKDLVFKEMLRVLKPGGRLQIADILVQKPVPNNAKNNLDLWAG